MRPGKLLLPLALALLLPVPGRGQIPVKDINTNYPPGPGQGSNPVDLVALGDRVFFRAFAGNNPERTFLQVSDPSGPVLPVLPGATDGGFDSMRLGDRLFMACTTAATGLELWVTDGPLGGARLFMDINPGPKGSNLHFLAVLGGRIFFFANDGVHGLELWTTDGTPAGTGLVKDIRQEEERFPAWTATAVGRVLYFLLDDSVHGVELWCSDGTASGTRLVKDIRPGPAGQLDPRPPSDWLWAACPLGGQLLFVADDGVHGRELWRTDGTAAGTVMVKDLNPGSGHGIMGGTMLPLHGCVHFMGDDGVRGREPWRSDGTTAGTAMVADLEPGSGDGCHGLLAVLGDEMLLSGYMVGAGRELLASDGTAAGTRLVKDINPGPEHSVVYDQAFPLPGNRFLLVANDGVHGYEPWVTDGTAAGTCLVKDINPLGSGAGCFPLPVATTRSGLVYFAGTDHWTGLELWYSDGTAANTGRVLDLVGDNPGSRPSRLSPQYGMLLFGADDGGGRVELWTSRGSEATTVKLTTVDLVNWTLVQDLIPEPLFHLYRGRTVFLGRPASTCLPMVTDGTPGGTLPLAGGNLLPGRPEQDLAVLGDRLFYAGSDAQDRDLLQVVDGAAGSGTGIVLPPRGLKGLSPVSFTPLGEQLLFVAQDGPHGYELWRSDGTPAGTTLVRDINPGPPDAFPRLSFLANLRPFHWPLARFRKQVLFGAADGSRGVELWRSDGTTAGTVLVRDLHPGLSGSIPMSISEECNGFALFRASSPGGFCDELWRTDGTAAGTRQVASCASLKARVDAMMGMTVVGDRVFFAADDGQAGLELWCSDGTPGGTGMVKDLLPGPAGSQPVNMIAAGRDLLFFATNMTPTGYTMWRSDGTAAGTVVLDRVVLNSTPLPSLPLMAISGGMLYYAAATANYGLELHLLDPGPTAVPLPGGRSVTGVPPILTAAAPCLGRTMEVKVGGLDQRLNTLLLMGLPVAPLHLGGGCHLFLDPATAIAWPLAGTIALPVPADRSLVGLRLVLQGLSGPSATPPLGVDFSNPVYLRLARAIR